MAITLTVYGKASLLIAMIRTKINWLKRVLFSNGILGIVAVNVVFSSWMRSFQVGITVRNSGVNSIFSKNMIFHIIVACFLAVLLGRRY